MRYDTIDQNVPLRGTLLKPLAYGRFYKRIIDLFLSVIALIFLAPLLVPVALILLLTGEHEVFYRQTRIGFKTKTFKIWKFATMRKGSSKIGTGSLTLRNDPRVLPVGKYLRKTKVNELPQIINVLIGNMSIVGPRPLMEVDYNKFPEHVKRNIYNSKPGITGIGSIIFRDEEKWISNSGMDPHEYDRKVIAPYKGELELWYLKNMSFQTDAKLIFCTAWVIFFPDSQLPQKIFKGLPAKPESLNKMATKEMKTIAA